MTLPHPACAPPRAGVSVGTSGRIRVPHLLDDVSFQNPFPTFAALPGARTFQRGIQHLSDITTSEPGSADA
ncbi:hypothetical protein, partial [Stenotrophomonas sp. BIIR7]|uniref:hypothetical protein n=1 Tax=Stenotrophomonas sp. BIIR7 TaxID=1904462 RepID=UPI001C405DCC